jgi:hypothetical protein
MIRVGAALDAALGTLLPAVAFDVAEVDPSAALDGRTDPGVPSVQALNHSAVEKASAPVRYRIRSDATRTLLRSSGPPEGGDRRSVYDAIHRSNTASRDD